MRQLFKTIVVSLIFFISYAQSDKVKVYLNCPCDDDFIKQNTLLFDYVRDRTLSDIEVFVFEITNAGGGRNYTFEYKGNNDFQNMDNQINVDIPRNLTFVEAREQLLRTFKLGMVYFLQNTPFNNQLEVTFLDEKFDLEESLDQWNNWVFEVSGSFNFENEKASRRRNITWA